MKRILSLITAVLLTAACKEGVKPAIKSDPAVESKVESVLKSMTLEEKIGQMCQIDFSVFMLPDNSGIDYAKLDSLIRNYKIGSILNCPWGRAQSRELYSGLISHIQEVSMETMGIPCIYGLDQNHGASYVAGTTFFPQEIGMAATFNRDLVKGAGEIDAYETRASMVPWTFNPTMDLGVNPVWPRIWESFGEDPYVNAEMGKALTRGYQGDDPNHLDTLRMAACIKHFMAYGAAVNGQDRTQSSVTDNDMRGLYFEPFKECALDGALSLMVNSGSNCGIPFHANAKYITKWLKEELGWDGMVVSDFKDLDNLYKREYVAKDKKDAIRIGINAGIDMVMEPYHVEFCDLLKELVEEGEVKMSRIDDAVRRILRLKVRLGLFEHPTWDTAAYDRFACDEFAAKARATAAESEILLKNDGVLPLREGARILLTGPNANSMRALNGGWSYQWQGSYDGSYHDRYNTILEAFQNRFGERNIIFSEGVRYEGDDWQNDVDCGISQAVAAARSCDVVVACIGENSYCETPGNINDLRLSENQRNLVKALAAVGKPVVLVLNEGRPRVIRDIEPLAAAVVDILLPGNYGGDALADLVSGDENFSGRLPYTYPAHPNATSTYNFRRSQQLEMMEGVYNYDAKVDVQWPFGTGLSYTTFEYCNFTLDKTSFTSDDILTFKVDVRNTGERAGSESVLLFSSDLIASVSPEVRRLREFTKIELQPGETKTVTLTVPASRLAFVGIDGRWTLEEGDFIFTAGSEKIDAKCTSTRIWDTPNI